MAKSKNYNESEELKAQKIAAIREMISNAERTIQSARAMLAQIEGTTPKKKKITPAIEEEVEGEIIEGVFDGQVMIGTDGKQYPVPANYASKSKLVEGDMLKLTITSDGSFIYKQIGPVERKRLIGIVSQDDLGNYVVVAEGKAYRILLASATYFKIEPGDEVTIVVPRDSESIWGAIENVVKKGAEIAGESFKSTNNKFAVEPSKENDDFAQASASPKIGKDGKLDSDVTDELIDEWTPEIEELKEEMKKPIT